MITSECDQKLNCSQWVIYVSHVYRDLRVMPSVFLAGEFKTLELKLASESWKIAGRGLVRECDGSIIGISASAFSRRGHFSPLGSMLGAAMI
jgi:hypothetical protein